MITKEKIKFPLLKDKVAKKLFTEKQVGLEYLRKIISLAIGIPMDMIDKDIKLIHPNIGVNKNIVNSEADVVLENNEFYVNLEINYYNNETSDIKNGLYLCHLLLRQVKKAKEYEALKKVYQINLNSYDALGKEEFIYHSKLYEKKYHIERSDFIEIIDINLEKLRQIDYNTLVKSEDMTLEKALYLFVCDDIEKLNAIYEGDRLMKKLMKENEDLLKNFDEMLYYDRDKMFLNACYEKGYDKGKQEARQERNIEIAKEMLNKRMKLKDIIDITGLTEKEIKEIV
uniref:Rpn family recombination-promoting nuclease/putative transposase n=1 Tax=Candidatus Ventrenecus sp. TaxID=3085654 RepID=UPI00402A339F